MVKIKITYLEWDAHNKAHIARHNIIPTEVEEICINEVVKLKSKTHDIRIVLIGKTQAKRTITVVLEFKKRNIWRPVTAYDASRKERKLYKEEIGGK